jgi:antitoxin VapB
VRVSRIGGKVILEPLEKPVFDVKAWRARLDSYLDTPFSELGEEAPISADDTISFD